jgi:N,N'-diacetyllegionaminate synthase
MYIIAELGSNWSTYNHIMEAPEIAKKCGASAIKYQMFTHEDLKGPIAKAQTSNTLPNHLVPQIKERCQKAGIDFMCTGFSVESYLFLNDFVDRHKVASCELSHPQILSTLNELKKPVILSTAGHVAIDIGLALKLIPNCHTTLLYCEGFYPATRIDMMYLTKLRNTFGRDYEYGYSDHSIDVNYIPRLSQQYGATMIEKHFNPFGVQSDDTPHSLDIDDFFEMCSLLKDASRLPSSKNNSEFVHKSHRRPVVTSEVKAGDKLFLNKNYGFFRGTYSELNSLNSFFYYNDIEGKVSLKALRTGHILAEGDLS